MGIYNEKLDELVIRLKSMTEAKPFQYKSDPSWQYLPIRNAKQVVFNWITNGKVRDRFQTIQNSCGRTLLEDLGYEWIENLDEFEYYRHLPVGSSYEDSLNGDKFFPLNKNWFFEES